MKLKADDFKDMPDINDIPQIDTYLSKPLTPNTSKEEALEEARKVAEIIGRKIDAIPEREFRMLEPDIEELLLLAAHLSAAVEML